MAGLSAYEQERLSRIQDNQKFLQALGLGAGDKKMGAIFSEPKPAPKKQSKKKEKKEDSDFVPRRSSRARSSIGSANGDSASSQEMASLDDEEDDVHDEPAKKKPKDQGVRVVWGRTYDPINGTTCHQCRQKTLELKVACTNIVEDYYGNKQICNVKLDEACLTNRYGQTIEAALASGEWKCPKCLGVCNCSFCRRKKGLTPTGILIQKARAAGYDSVDAYLRNGPPSTKKTRAKKPKPEIAASIAAIPAIPPIPPIAPAQLPTFLPNLNADNIIISSGPSEFIMSDLLTQEQYSPYADQLIYSDASFSTPTTDTTFTPDFTPTSTPGDYSSSLSDFSPPSSQYNPFNFDYPKTPFQPSDISQLHLDGVDDPIAKMDVPSINELPPLPPALPPLPTTPIAISLNIKTDNDNDDKEIKLSLVERPYEPDEFDVEKILDMKTKTTRDGKEEVFYLVQWTGDMENSWEPQANLYCEELVDLFLKSRQANGNGTHKKSSPKRRQDSASPTDKDMGAKKMKKEQQAEEMAATPGKGKRANRGRNSHLSDYHFF